jgi:cysteine sulfinate desulfinase/cysteine desulfurase-like protein
VHGGQEKVGEAGTDDAAFIAALRNAFPSLIARMKAAEAAVMPLERLRAILEAAYDSGADGQSKIETLNALAPHPDQAGD